MRTRGVDHFLYREGRFWQLSAKIEFSHQIFRGPHHPNQSQDVMWHFLTKFN
jgi:hypothetical protein